MKKQPGGFYVAEIKRSYKDRVYVTYLLRRVYREDGKVKQQTLGNLTHLPLATIRLLRESLRGRRLVPVDVALEIVRTRPHGHVAAVRAMLHQLGLPEILAPRPSFQRNLVEALIVSRILRPQAKLATVRWWATTTLAEDLGLEGATKDDVYFALDWLLARQARIEARLARRHLSEHSLVLYDITSTYYEGSHCPLAAFGHNRDGKRGKRQIVFGIVTDGQGRPVAVEVYRGNTSDPKTVGDQVHKIRERFGLRYVVLVGDRGMLTQARIEALKGMEGMAWISALRAPALRQLMDQGLIQPALFDERDLAEITSPDYPGERLIVCRNPYLAEERRRTREELLAATEAALARLARRVAAGRLKRPEKIGEAVGRILAKSKMGTHFRCEVGPGRFAYRRDPASIEQEAALDGFYVIRTSVPAEVLSAEDVVLGYKRLSHAERLIRTIKTVVTKVRPIHHWTEDRVRAHIFLCVLASYVEWHLREAWAPFLFDDE
ncbi:MAG: IS1634 family transposase, partial [Firmicutes bacterium]|nr:IS1634 family transposase [Bacillota bacterium]